MKFYDLEDIVSKDEFPYDIDIYMVTSCKDHYFIKMELGENQIEVDWSDDEKIVKNFISELLMYNETEILDALLLFSEEDYLPILYQYDSYIYPHTWKYFNIKHIFCPNLDMFNYLCQEYNPVVKDDSIVGFEHSDIRCEITKDCINILVNYGISEMSIDGELVKSKMKPYEVLTYTPSGYYELLHSIKNKSENAKVLLNHMKPFEHNRLFTSEHKKIFLKNHKVPIPDIADLSSEILDDPSILELYVKYNPEYLKSFTNETVIRLVYNKFGITTECEYTIYVPENERHVHARDDPEEYLIYFLKGKMYLAAKNTKENYDVDLEKVRSELDDYLNIPEVDEIIGAGRMTKGF